MNVFQCGYILLVAVLFSPVVAAWQNTPRALQISGIARLDRYRDHVRRSGDQRSLLNELAIAATELENSYRGFTAASNYAQAAWSLVKLGDCERLTMVSALTSSQIQADDARTSTLARDSRSHYETAAALARKTGSSSYLVKALLGLALLDETHDHNYGSANAHVTEALRAASSCPRDCFLDALGAKVDVEIGRGELISAASHVNGLLALLKTSTDAYQHYVAYSNRANIYRAMAEGCSYNQQKSVDICFRLFDLAKTDYLNARDFATLGGFTYFGRLAEEEIQGVGQLRNLTESYNSMSSRVFEKVRFEPKTAKDVLATEIIPLGQVSPQDSRALDAYRQLAGRGMPGYLATWVKAQMDDIERGPDAALEGYLRAIQIVEEDRRRLGEDSARSTYLDDKIDIYNRPILILLKNKRYAEAFDLIERSRARATADLLRTKSLGLSRPVDRKVFATLALKRAEITSLQTNFFDAAFFTETDIRDDPETVKKAQTHLAELEAEYEQLLLRIAREAPRTQDLAVSRPVSLETVQTALRQDSTDLLYYFLLDHAVILIHIGPRSFHVRNVFLPRLPLMSKVAALRDSMRKKDAPFREDLAKELFLYLIQPALGWLSGDRLVIIPQAELQSLPFQVFQDPVSGATLGEHFQISYAPSASILLQLRRQRNLAGGALLAACDPSLPGAPEEVKTLARFYPARQKVLADSLIRKADFKQWVGSYDILHLAVHGEFDSEEPLLSKVKLAGGAGENGDLTAAEMFGLPLDKTRIATLSACESGRLRTTRSNEIQGIVQALLFAGAQSVLVSAWKVDSESTSLWMQTFYREAQTKTPAEAAREAIRTVHRDPRYTHPFYWAPFLLVAR